MQTLLRLIEAAGAWMERAVFIPIFRRAVLADHGVHGVGYIERADGSRTPFTIRGDVTGSALQKALAKHAGALFGGARGPFRRMWGAVTHPTAVRTLLANTVVDLIDAGSAAGYLEFDTSGDAEVATLPFGDPAFGNAASGVATANAITSDTNATGGTIAKAFAADSDDTPVFLCAVGTSGSDINLSSLAVGAGDTVAVSSLTYTAPP